MATNRVPRTLKYLTAPQPKPWPDREDLTPVPSPSAAAEPEGPTEPVQTEERLDSTPADPDEES